MGENPVDLVELAEYAHGVGLDHLGLELMEKRIKSDAKLDRKALQVLGNLFKALIDSDRLALRELHQAFTSDATKLSQGCLDALDRYQQKYLDELRGLCMKALEIAHEQLLPGADTPATQVFVHKFEGDIARYLAESAEEENLKKYIDQAAAAYGTATSIATESLSEADPLRVGTILNHAVFAYEHLHDPASAIEMVGDAIQKALTKINDLSEEGMRETRGIIDAMETDLVIWQGESTEDSTEEEK